jgi:hypothetical protein
MSQERRRPTRAPLPRSSASNSTLSIVIAVVAVVLGFFILRDISQDGSSSPTATEETTATEQVTEETIATETTVAAPTIPLTSFKIQVANASKISGSAGQLTTELQGRGYIVQPALNANDATPKQNTTVVYYLPGSEAQAALVAGELGGVATAPMPAPIPTDSGNLGEASVLIMLGTDVAGKPLGTPVPTAPPATAATETTVAEG